MSSSPINRFLIAFVFTLLTAAVMVGAAGPAYAADDCLLLGGNAAFLPGECRIDAARTASDAAHGGPFTINEPLRITGTGSIIVPAAPGGNALTLNIAGDLTIDLPTVAGGGRISGDVTTASGIGATISIEATGNILVHGSGATGAKITSNQAAGSCSGGRGGNISVSANGSIITEPGSAITSTSICGRGEIILVADASVTVKGVVSSDSNVGRGGPVSVSAGCTLAVAATGRVTSQGKDPGADLVHLQGGCDVLIEGKVESTGPGHVRPPVNRCHAPDKPANASACVEVWSGGTITVDATSSLKGEINVDTAQSGGVNCCAWIDLFAMGDIAIKGDTGGIFALHANQLGVSNAFGGWITVKSRAGNITATGFAIQAKATLGGSTGGIVAIEAKGNVDLDDAQIDAKGDADAGGGFGTGGTVGARAFSGTLSWANLPGGVQSTGDVRPTGTGIPAAQRGAISLTSCGASSNTTGTLFPFTLGVSTNPALPPNVCSPAAPDVPSYVSLPDCVCAGPGIPDVSIVKSATKPIINAGEIASYTITVTADGTANSTNVKLTDVVPSGFTWTVGGADAQSCSPASPPPIAGGTTLTCSFGTMAPGATRTITLSTQTTASNASCPTGVTITNTAMATYDGDLDTSDDSSGPVTITVKCPDVSVVKTTTTPTINPGASATYNVVVTAGASTSSTNVVLTDVLPAGPSWTVGGADAGSCSPSSPVAGGTTLTCAFGTMAPSSTKTITLTATTSTTNCPAINNTASVSSDADTNPGNNTSGPVTITINCADVMVVKTATTPAVTAGDQASYSVVVTANGPGSSTNVVLTDTLPAGLSWTVGGPDAAACSPSSPIAGGNTLTCTFATIAQNATKTITLTATTSAADCAGINNTASVTASGDTNSGNNTSGPVRITVSCAADVKVTKSTSTPSIAAGAQASYAITVTANGPASSNNVVLADVLPSGLNWTVSGPDAGACSPSSPIAGGNTLTCAFGTMAKNATKTITLTATTTSANCPGITNTAGVSAEVDTNSTNNTSGAVAIAVSCAADVTVTKTTTTPTVTAGGQASYGVTVTANGPTSSTHVVLTDTLPAGLNWTVGGLDAGSCSPASPVAGGTTLTCSFGTMAPGATKTITLAATTSSANCPGITNTAGVSADVDTDSTNNTSGAVAIAVNCADVQVTKTTTTPTIKAGQQASYNITVTANGPTSSTNVVLSDTLPAGLTWTVGGTDKANCALLSGTLTCTFGTMAPQATKSITLTAPTLSANCPSINNTASVSADMDTNPSNNTSGPVNITVRCDGP